MRPKRFIFVFEGQRIRCLITDLHKDFVTRAGVEVFTVRADEIAPSGL
jgi:hypothetical protein